GPWSVCDHLWSFGSQWRVSLGSGADTANFDTVETDRSLSVRGGSGDDTVNLDNATISGRTCVAMGSGQDQISVQKSTLDGPVLISTGSGDGQSVSVDDSTFKSHTTIVAPGDTAQVKIETAHISGPGTTFQKSVAVVVPGPSAVVDFSGASPDNTLTF